MSRSAVLTQLNAPLELHDLCSRTMTPGQVVVRITMAGLCGAQLQEIRGEKDNERFIPHLMGHEGCGIVEEVSETVRTVKVGDKVCLHWMKGEGADVDGAVYYKMDESGQRIGSGPIHTFATHVVISENRCTAIPQDTPDELATLLGCALSTALGVVENEARVKMGESVLVVGCGGVGLCVIAAAKAMGPHILHACDSKDKGELALKCGAHTFSQPGYGFTLAPNQFNVIIDTTGSPEAIAETLPLLASGGRFVLVGQPKPGADIVITSARHLFDGSKRIIASNGGGFRPAIAIPRYIAAWRSGALKIDGIVTHRFGLDQINEALDTLRGGSAGRVMIDMNL